MKILEKISNRSAITGVQLSPAASPPTNNGVVRLEEKPAIAHTNSLPEAEALSWSEREATVLIRETMAVYRGVLAPGASIYHTEDAKREYWSILDQIEHAGERKDMAAVRRLCKVLRERGKLPRLSRWEMQWLGYEYRSSNREEVIR